jgi:hypothetical protein
MEKNIPEEKKGHGMLVPALFVIGAIVLLALIKILIS